MIEDLKGCLEDTQYKNELRALIQEEIWKAFDIAMKAAADPPVGLHQLNDEEFRAIREVQKQMVKEISQAVRSALNHLKADAQARAVETTDPERASRIKALADPTF
jgi:vacuolar-type H+-ATPase subunit E/Vma4